MALGIKRFQNQAFIHISALCLLHVRHMITFLVILLSLGTTQQYIVYFFGEKSGAVSAVSGHHVTLPTGTQDDAELPQHRQRATPYERGDFLSYLLINSQHHIIFVAIKRELAFVFPQILCLVCASHNGVSEPEVLDLFPDLELPVLLSLLHRLNRLCIVTLRCGLIRFQHLQVINC